MWYEKLAMILAAIGALNLGLTEIGWNVIESAFSWAGATTVSIIYYILALAGLYTFILAFKEQF
jgi:uncharacterized membrane protein YuzA (DUF378 family)